MTGLQAVDDLAVRRGRGVGNARATGQLQLQRGDEHGTYTMRELDADEAVPVLRCYLRTPARFFVRRHVAVSARSTDEAIAAEAGRHPVFELTAVR